MQQSSAQAVNSGRWTAKEHVLFLEALKTHGQDWRRIAWDLKTRNNVQVRTHAQKYFKKLERMKRKAMLKQQQSQHTSGSRTKPELKSKRTKVSSSESSEDEREEEDDVDDYEDGEFTESDTDTSDKGAHQKVRSSINNSSTDAASASGQPAISRMISSDGTLMQTFAGFAPQNGPMMQQTCQMMMMPAYPNGAPQLLGPALTAYPSIFRPIASVPNGMMPQLTATKPWPQGLAQQMNATAPPGSFPQAVAFNGVQMMATVAQQQQQQQQPRYQMVAPLTGISGINAYGSHMLHTPARNNFSQ